MMPRRFSVAAALATGETGRQAQLVPKREVLLQLAMPEERVSDELPVTCDF